jgi:hypothetical protein
MERFEKIIVLFTINLLVFCCSCSSSSKPTITLFELTSSPMTSNSTVTFNLEATDSTGVTDWLITETSTKPVVSDPTWLGDKPSSYLISSDYGNKELFAWAKNTAGGISDPASISIHYVAKGTEDATYWNKRFINITGDDSANAVAVDSQNNVYVVGQGAYLISPGSSLDWWIKKYDSNGNEDTTNWNKKFDGNNGMDGATAVAIDADDNVFVAGPGQNLISGSSGYDWWIKKFDLNGNEDTVHWNKQFDGNGGDDNIASIVVDSDKNLYVFGIGTNIVSGSSGWDWWIKKFDSNGNEDTANWNKKIDNGASGDDYPHWMGIDKKGNIYCVGSADNLAAIDTYGDWWIKKFDANGNEDTANWNKKIDGGYKLTDDAEGIAFDSHNNVYVVGSVQISKMADPGTNKTNWWIKEFDENGVEDTVNWNKQLDGNENNDAAFRVIVDSYDNLYIGGYATNIVNASSKADWWIKKFDSNGSEDTTAWNKKFDGNNLDDWILGMAEDSYNNIYVVGYGTGIVSANPDALAWWIKKFIND